VILSIVEMDEVILRQKTHEVAEPLMDIALEDTQDLIRNMFDTLDNAKGYGLAAPQVNRTERVFVFSNGNRRLAFVNPVITKRWGNAVGDFEGCLSLPGVTVKVPRHKFIKIDYTDANGQRHTNQKFRGHDARVIQHEFDHLEGRLIIDYARRV